ncbi:MAG: hypothetical protein ABTD50_18850 [Polyangiaceae bacterium]|jgi:hypothetical protein
MNRVVRTIALAGFAALAPRAAHAECVETTPTGAERPQTAESFPERATSGYEATLRVVVSHGKGEVVLPHGLELQRDGDTAKALAAAGFELPDQDGGAKARLSSIDVDAKSGRRQTTLELPLVALPKDPGRHVLVLPSLPVSIARANNDVVTVCTKPHSVLVDDPTSSTPDAKPRPNPPPRAQREPWDALRRALGWTAVGIAFGGAVAWLLSKWLRRPRRVPPPPPPRPPWEVALERLDETRHAGLLKTKRFAEFFDRVNDAVRQYLGARFGFDGLESTTDETLAALRRAPHFSISIAEIAVFLQHCDLVKFADLTPSLDDCENALREAEHLVRDTMPTPTAQPLRTPPQEVGR